MDLLSETSFKQVLRDYFEGEARLKALSDEKDALRRSQMGLLETIHLYMKDHELDELNVNNVRFTRGAPKPRKPRLKDDVLKSVLMKHVGSEKVQTVLDEVAQGHANKEKTPTPERLGKRVLRPHTTVLPYG